MEKRNFKFSQYGFASHQPNNYLEVIPISVSLVSSFCWWFFVLHTCCLLLFLFSVSTFAVMDLVVCWIVHSVVYIHALGIDIHALTNIYLNEDWSSISKTARWSYRCYCPSVTEGIALQLSCMTEVNLVYGWIRHFYQLLTDSIQIIILQ